MVKFTITKMAGVKLAAKDNSFAQGHKSDPYLMIRENETGNLLWDGSKDVKKQTLDPVWDPLFFDTTAEMKLHITVMDSDSMARDDTIGVVTVTVGELYHYADKKVKLQLVDYKEPRTKDYYAAAFTKGEGGCPNWPGQLTLEKIEGEGVAIGEGVDAKWLLVAENSVLEAEAKMANLKIVNDIKDPIFEKDTKFLTNGKQPAETCAFSGFSKEGVVALYFSAHWCPPCRGFTPKLAESYKAIRESGKAFQVVFLSSDKNDEAFLEYFAEQPWLALPFAERDLKEKLSKKYDVEGLPCLVLLDAATGDIITKNGRAELSSDSAVSNFPWK